MHYYMPKLTITIIITTFLHLIIPCLSECRSQCGKIPINYPLSIDDGCGAPQFRHMFTCNASSLALFFITPNGNYKVQSIDYKAQTLTVYDPDMSTCTVLQPHHDLHLSDVQYAIIPPSPDTVFALLNCSVDSPVLHRYSFLCFEFAGHKCPELYSSCNSFRVFTTGGLVNPGAGNNTGPNGYFYGGGGGGGGNAGNTSAGFGTGVPGSSGSNNIGAGPPIGGFGTSKIDTTNDDDYMGTAPPGGGLGGGSGGGNNNIGDEPPSGGFGGGGSNIGGGPPSGGFGSSGNDMGAGPPSGGFGGGGGNNAGIGPPSGGNMGAGPPDGGGFGTGGNNNMGTGPPGGGMGTGAPGAGGGVPTPPCCFTGYSTLKVMSMDILDCSHYTSFYEVDKLKGVGPMDWSYGLKFSFSVPDMGCERCTKSGGSCGFDVQTEALLCLCPDSRNSTRQCGNDMDDGRRGMPSIVLQIFVMFLGLLFFLC